MKTIKDKSKNKYCVCLGIEKTQKHHIFRFGFRKRMHSLGIDKITLFWEKPDGIVENNIPVDAYVRFCDECHKLCHPENIDYHLNQLVVNALKNGNNTVVDDAKRE